MKKEIKSMLLLIMTLISVNIHASSTKTIKTKIDKATVYLAGATLYSTGDFSLNQGLNELIFEGVSPQLDRNSLQATGKGDFIIMDVKFNIKYNEKITDPKIKSKFEKALKQLNDSLLENGYNIEELNDKLAGLASEKNIILNNRLMKGETKQDTLALFIDAMTYLRSKLNNINNETYKIKRELSIKNEIQKQLNNKLTELINLKNKDGESITLEPAALYQIIVTVMAETETTGKVTVNYFINNAGWKPGYDIRAVSINNNITVTQKAQLYQSTGVDWNNATLTLSTGTPNQGTVKPELNPMYLSFYTAYRTTTGSTVKKPTMNEEDLSNMNLQSASRAKQADEAKDIAQFTEMVENLIQTEYNIKLKYSIPSDGKEHLIMIQNKEIKAEYNFSAVPKLDPNAYLIAKIINWEELNLIPGESRVFFDGSYLGRSFIDPNITSDTLLFSLGRDKSIVMTRKKLKDKTKEKMLIDQKIMTFSYEITLKNTKTLAVRLNLEDQIPVSSDKGIEIKLLDSNKAAYNVENGKLEWDINLKPNETKKLMITYQVTIPKDKSLAGL